MKTEDLSLRHSFVTQELADMGREQAQKLDSLGILRGDLDSVKKQYASQISEMESGINRISQKIHAGFEMRTQKCALLDHRLANHRIAVRLDNGHIVSKRKLGDEELQMTLTAEAPEPYLAIAVLHVDDPNWDIEAFECPLFEDEFQALRNLDVISIRDFPHGKQLGQQAEDEKPKKGNKRKD